MPTTPPPKYPLTRQLDSFEATVHCKAHTHSTHKSKQTCWGIQIQIYIESKWHILVSFHSGSLYFSKIDKLEIRSHRDVSLRGGVTFYLVQYKKAQGPPCPNVTRYGKGQWEHYKSNTANFWWIVKKESRDQGKRTYEQKASKQTKLPN